MLSPTLDPTHERGLKNREYFDKMADEDPDKFLDTVEVEDEKSEHARYETLCRRPDPIVSRDVMNLNL